MLSEKELAAYLHIQQIAISTTDESKLLENVLPGILTEFSALVYNYDFLVSLFLTPNNTVQVSYATNIYDKKVIHGPTLSFLNPSEFLLSESTVLLQLKAGELVVTSDIGKFLNTQYFNFSNIKSLVIAPMVVNNNLLGVLIFGSSRLQSQIAEAEKELISMLANMVSITYRLQDTEASLVKVTQQVYKTNAELHQLDKLKDDFVSIASHELRTPMTAIRSYAWMALNRSDVALSPKVKKYLERTLISTERLINLVNDMLNVSRIESGRVEIKPKSFDIQELIDEVLVEVAAKAKEKNLHLVMTKEKLPQVFADPDKVHQILLNLIGNAMKFTPIDGQVTVNCFSDGVNVDTSIKDSGVGISPDDLSHLFKKFGRLDNSYVAAATSGGTGLGLYICKSLVDLMKGKIWARSEGTNKGATFTFSLPVATEAVMKDAKDYGFKPQGEAKMLEPTAI